MAVVIAEVLLRVSDSSVLVESRLSSSLSLPGFSDTSAVQHASSRGLLSTYLFTRLANSPAHIGTNESVMCCGIISWITADLVSIVKTDQGLLWMLEPRVRSVGRAIPPDGAGCFI